MEKFKKFMGDAGDTIGTGLFIAGGWTMDKLETAGDKLGTVADIVKLIGFSMFAGKEIKLDDESEFFTEVFQSKLLDK